MPLAVYFVNGGPQARFHGVVVGDTLAEGRHRAGELLRAVAAVAQDEVYGAAALGVIQDGLLLVGPERTRQGLEGHQLPGHRGLPQRGLLVGILPLLVVHRQPLVHPGGRFVVRVARCLVQQQVAQLVGYDPLYLVAGVYIVRNIGQHQR